VLADFLKAGGRRAASELLRLQPRAAPMRPPGAARLAAEEGGIGRLLPRASCRACRGPQLVVMELLLGSRRDLLDGLADSDADPEARPLATR